MVKTLGINIREATMSDAEALAEMNKHLIEDEGSRNPMNVAQLTERMRNMLQGEYKGLVVSDGDEDVGYMVYRESPDEYFPDQTFIYIRQYFIKRHRRGTGVGTEAFHAICRDIFPEGITLAMEVLEVNPGGRRFWEKVGFKPHLTYMKKNNK